MIPKSKWPNYDLNILTKITNILKTGKTNYLVGKEGFLFEKNFSKFYNIKYANVVANASLGLELSLLSLNLKRGDEVIVTPRSYHSSVSCVIRVGLTPVFADIDRITMNICPKSIRKNISKKTKAIICVHLYGMPCNMDEIIKLSKQYNLKIIEDCSQAHGSKIGRKYVGSFGDISVFSYCQDKIISTGGEGGMIATNSKKLSDKIWSLKDIGKDKKKFFKIDSLSNDFPYVHDTIGTNARLTEVQSCIGNYQLKKLKSYIRNRNENAKTFYNKLNNCEHLIIPNYKSQITHSFYRYTIILNNNKLSRSLLMKNLKKKGVSCTVGGCPTIYKEKFFIKKFNINKINFPNAEYLKNKTLSFLVDQTINKRDINQVCNILLDQINKILKKKINE